MIETIAIVITIVSVGISFYFGMKNDRDVFRFTNIAAGEVLLDKHGVSPSAADAIVRGGYRGNVKAVADLLKSKKVPFDVVVSPAEVDYLFAYHVARAAKKPFSSIHTSDEWPTELSRFRYYSVSTGDRVVFITVVLSDARFLGPAVSAIVARGATVQAVVTLAETDGGDDESDPAEIASQVAGNNVEYYCLRDHVMA